MSATTTPIPGRSFLFKVSDDNWTTTYTLECLISQRGRASRAKNSIDSQCGLYTSRGSVDRTYELVFMVNTTVDAVAAGVGPISGKQWQTWFENNTQLKFKRQWPTGSGTAFHQEGTIDIDSIDDEAEVAGYLIFTSTVSVQGPIDTTP
jgi:hypothetical protein